VDCCLHSPSRSNNNLIPLNLFFIALGEDSENEKIGQAELRFVSYKDDASSVARYYQAADIYLHAAHVDTFPTTVLEALACGTPVVATAVGGIPEQIKSLKTQNLNSGEYLLHEATGILIPPYDVNGMAKATAYLLNNEEILKKLGENAVLDARKRFDLNQQAKAYLSWYHEIIHKSKT